MNQKHILLNGDRHLFLQHQSMQTGVQNISWTYESVIVKTLCGAFASREYHLLHHVNPCSTVWCLCFHPTRSDFMWSTAEEWQAVPFQQYCSQHRSIDQSVYVYIHVLSVEFIRGEIDKGQTGTKGPLPGSGVNGQWRRIPKSLVKRVIQCWSGPEKDSSFVDGTYWQIKHKRGVSKYVWTKHVNKVQDNGCVCLNR